MASLVQFQAIVSSKKGKITKGLFKKESYRCVVALKIIIEPQVQVLVTKKIKNLSLPRETGSDKNLVVSAHGGSWLGKSEEASRSMAMAVRWLAH